MSVGGWPQGWDQVNKDGIPIGVTYTIPQGSDILVHKTRPGKLITSKAVGSDFEFLRTTKTVMYSDEDVCMLPESAILLGPAHQYGLAEWKKYHKAAGVIRNQRMIDNHPEVKLCLAFHDNLTDSKGTKDMVARRKKAGIPVYHFKTGSISPSVL